MHNLCILVGLQASVVETADYITAASIVVAGIEGLCARRLGHSALSKMLVECINSPTIQRVLGRFMNIIQ